MRNRTMFHAKAIPFARWLLATIVSVTALAQDPSLIAHYRFEGNAADSSGNQPIGTVNGPVLCEDRHGNPNGAYCFDGTNDYIDIGSGVKPPFPVTVLAWFRGAGSLIANDRVDDSGSRYGFLINTYSDVARVHFHSGFSVGSNRNAQKANGFVGFQGKTWNFLAVVMHSVSKTDWYINGQHYPGVKDQDGTGTAMTYSGSSGTIGVPLPRGYTYFQGAIDELLVFNRALSERQIASYYDVSSGGPGCDDCGTLVGGMLGNSTWTKAGSPYCVTNNVLALGTLAIESGVEVRFCGNYEFEVQGKLMVNGTADEPVHFRPADPQVGWQGLVFPNTQPGSYFVHAIIEGSKNSGLRLINCAPPLTNCQIINNSTPETGGGIKALIGDAGDWSLTGCVISNNTASYLGGGVRLDMGAFRSDLSRRFVAEQCVFAANEGAGFGGGFAAFSHTNVTLTLVNCRNIGNSVVSYPGHATAGAGFYFGGPTNVWHTRYQYELRNCVVTSNSARGQAGDWSRGAGLQQTGGSGVLRNCWITDNVASSSGANAQAYGAGVYHQGWGCLMENCVVARNAVAWTPGTSIGGSGIYQASNDFTVVNSTIFANPTAVGIWGAGRISVLNSIVFSNQPPQLPPHAIASWSCIQGGWASGTENISFSPALCPDNYSLAPASPCIDAGHPGLEYRDACVDNQNLCSPCARGTPRNDMGAYGGPGVAAWCGTCPQPTIVTQPPSTLFALPGNLPSLCVVAQDPLPLTYQWFKESLPLAGATNACLEFGAGVGDGDRGRYNVEIWNGQGTAISLPATLFLTEFVVRARMNERSRVELTICPYLPPRTVAIERAAELRGDGNANWERLHTMTVNADCTPVWEDPEPPTAAQRYYRVISVE